MTQLVWPVLDSLVVVPLSEDPVVEEGEDHQDQRDHRREEGVLEVGEVLRNAAGEHCRDLLRDLGEEEGPPMGPRGGGGGPEPAPVL